MHSLVADDSPLIRILLRTLLADYGKCDEARDGRETIAAFTRSAESETPYHLICLDLQMPELDGIAVLEQIRHIEKERQLASKVKILVISASDEVETVKLTAAFGADGYLLKPITKPALKSRLEVLLPEASAQFKGLAQRYASVY